MTTTIPTPQQLLSRAADIITERGWTQGDYITDDGCVCAVGAIGFAACEAVGITEEPAQRRAVYRIGGDSKQLQALMRDAEQLVSDHVFSEYPAGIVYWNDADARTADEVVAVLRAAAEEAV